MDGLADRLKKDGYRNHSARQMLSLTGKFSSFSQGAGVETAKEMDEELVIRFRKELGDKWPAYADVTMRHVFDYLYYKGVNTARLKKTAKKSFDELIDRYDKYLRDVRGLTPGSCEQYKLWGQRFISWLKEQNGDRSLQKLCGSDVIEFINAFINQHSSTTWRQQLCSRTRIFLKYLRWEDIINSEIERVVPKVTYRRLSSLPRHLSWSKIRTLIDSIDTTHSLGKRDKAVLLLISELGLRGGEICTMEIGHIDWRAAEIQIPKTKSCRERILPLSQESGAALADYLLLGRPALNFSQVFLRHLAPLGPLKRSSSVGSIVRRHLKRVGIEAPSYGTHLLRHSLATRMVNVGVPIKTISDILGHISIDATAIYTKVDQKNLAAVAMPFPQRGEA